MSLFSIITGHTCGDACWHARELVCRCSCGGVNHGILNTGGKRPQRTCKIDGNFYELAGIIPDTGRGDGYNAGHKAMYETLEERFPGLCDLAYGNWREEKTMPVVHRQISATQAKWPEVMAVPDAKRLVWARPIGTRYYVRGPNHTHILNPEKLAA